LASDLCWKAAAGLLRGRRRVLDYTPLFDAAATQDTVIQLRAAIRKVHSAADRADPQRGAAVRAAWPATTITPRSANRRATGTAPTLGKRSSTGWCETPWLRWQSKTTTNYPLHWPRPPKRWL
jgi:hypothetical protein